MDTAMLPISIYITLMCEINILTIKELIGMAAITEELNTADARAM
jgi:hypothetical protein